MAAFIAVAQVAGKLAERHGLARVVSVAVRGFGFLGRVVPTTIGDGAVRDGAARPMVAGIAVVAVIAWALTRRTLRAASVAPGAPAARVADDLR